MRVRGKLPPETENPEPEIESELIVTAAVPLDVSVTDLVTAVPTETFPKESEVALKLIAGTAAFNVIAKLFEDAFAVALTVAVWLEVTVDAAALKDAVEAPAATVTLAGTVRALELLATAMLWPPERAAPLNVTVQLVLPEPVNAFLPQVRALTEGATPDEELLSFIDVVFVVDPCVAVRVTVCDAVTAETVAAKDALVDPEATVTDAGTATALLLLARFTTTPALGAAAESFTVQLSLPAPM